MSTCGGAEALPEDRTPDPRLEHPTLQLRLDKIELAHPRQWGACWLALELWGRLDLDAFWQHRPTGEGSSCVKPALLKCET